MLSGDAPVVVSSQLLNRQDGEDEYHVQADADGVARRPAQGRRLRGPGAAAAHPHGQGRPDDARLPVRELADDGRRRRRPRRCAPPTPTRSSWATSRTSPRWSSASTPRRATRCGSRRPWPTTPRAGCPCASCPTAAAAPSTGPPATTSTTGWPSSGTGTTTSGRPADVEVARTTRPRRDPAGDPVQPLHARPGQRPGRRARGRGQGGHRLGLRGPLLLGQRGLRRAVPHLHAPRARPQPAALPQPDAARRARAGPRAEPARGAVPVAHHQRRGGLGLLRRRHRPGAHRRRRRLRPRAVRQRHRRRGLPGARRPRRSSSRPPGSTPTSGSGAATASASFHIHGVTGPDEYTTVVNNNLFTNVMARYNLEQAVQWVRVDPPPGARRVRPDRAEAGPHRRRGHRVGGLRRGHAHPVRRGPAASTRRTTSSSTARSGTSAAPRRSCGPLLLHYHPLVIYRFQVLKQADVVLALFLQGDRFTARGEARGLRVLRPDHHRRLHPVGGRAVGHRGRGRLPRGGATATSSTPCTSTSPTCTTTPSTACTSPPPAGCGPRWSTGSAACATTTGGCPSTRACPTAGSP